MALVKRKREIEAPRRHISSIVQIFSKFKQLSIKIYSFIKLNHYFKRIFKFVY